MIDATNEIQNIIQKLQALNKQQAEIQTHQTLLLQQLEQVTGDQAIPTTTQPYTPARIPTGNHKTGTAIQDEHQAGVTTPTSLITSKFVITEAAKHTDHRPKDQLETTKEEQVNKIQSDTSTNNKHHSTDIKQPLQVGDHIYIKNKVTHSNYPSCEDRTAIITDIQGHQVYLTTYTGVETWRSPYNIHKLTKQERATIQPPSHMDE